MQGNHLAFDPNIPSQMLSFEDALVLNHGLIRFLVTSAQEWYPGDSKGADGT